MVIKIASVSVARVKGQHAALAHAQDAHDAKDAHDAQDATKHTSSHYTKGLQCLCL